MDKPAELRTDGPHSPEYTREVAGAVAEGIRVLNYATGGRDWPGLDYPGDAYDLLGWLYTATQRLPQLFTQLAGFLVAQGASSLADDQGRDPQACTAAAASDLERASTAASALTKLLQDAQLAISGLYVKDSGDG
jgi:hypothetical protein